MTRCAYMLTAGLVALLLSACADPDRRAVATVDNEEITVADFRERFQTYLNASGVRDTYESRRQVINNMVNEKLILRDLRESLWFDRPDIRRRISEIERQALLDAFAAREVYDTVTVTERELAEEFQAWNSETSARYLYGETEHEAIELKKRLERGETFEKLAREVFRDPGLAANGGSVGFYGRGEMEPAFEKAAAGLAVGEVSGPVKIGIGFAIIRVDERRVPPLLSEWDFARKKGDLESSVRERKNTEALEEVSRRVAEELEPRFNETLVESLFGAWETLVSREVIETQGQALPTGSWADSLLVEFSEGGWTAGDLVGRIHELTPRQLRAIRSTEDLKRAITGLAARDVLLERARASDLDEDPNVRKQVASVTLQVALKEWARAIEDSVAALKSDESLIFKVFQENLERFVVPPRINVAEILVRTKPEAHEILARLRRGADFAALARERSIRLWAAKQGGEMGYRTVGEYGALGQKFLEARPGEIVGPEFVDPYYGVFKILGRQESRRMTLDEARPEIEGGIRREQTSKAVRAAIEVLRQRYSFTIDDATIQDISLVKLDS